MNYYVKPRGPADIGNNLVDEIEKNVRVLPRDPARFPEIGGKLGEPLAENLSDLLNKVSESSAREIDHLIDELQMLRGKLQSDTDRIQHDIANYAVVSEQVLQLTRIISESVEKLPDASA